MSWPKENLWVVLMPFLINIFLKLSIMDWEEA